MGEYKKKRKLNIFKSAFWVFWTVHYPICRYWNTNATRVSPSSWFYVHYNGSQNCFVGNFINGKKCVFLFMVGHLLLCEKKDLAQIRGKLNLVLRVTRPDARVLFVSRQMWKWVRTTLLWHKNVDSSEHEEPIEPGVDKIWKITAAKILTKDWTSQMPSGGRLVWINVSFQVWWHALNECRRAL